MAPQQGLSTHGRIISTHGWVTPAAPAGLKYADMFRYCVALDADWKPMLSDSPAHCQQGVFGHNSLCNFLCDNEYTGSQPARTGSRYGYGSTCTAPRHGDVGGGEGNQGVAVDIICIRALGQDHAYVRFGDTVNRTLLCDTGCAEPPATQTATTVTPFERTFTPRSFNSVITKPSVITKTPVDGGGAPPFANKSGTVSILPTGVLPTTAQRTQSHNVKSLSFITIFFTQHLTALGDGAG